VTTLAHDRSVSGADASPNAPLPVQLPVDAAIAAIVERHGEAERARAEAGVRRVAERWIARDGDAEAFRSFCVASFVPRAKLPMLLDRLEFGLEQVRGHLYEMRRNLRVFNDRKDEELPAIDDCLATFDPAPDLSEQAWRQKLGFVAVLNLDRPSLATMLSDGPSWDAATWAAARICRGFTPRMPVEVNDLARAVSHRSSQWVAKFHVPVGRLVDDRGTRHWGPDRALLAHWLVREEIKAGYGEPDGLRRQRALAWVMARHIDGSIPAEIMERRGEGDWDAARNTIGGKSAGETVGLARYERWIEQRDLAFTVDRHWPEYPTAIRRKCDEQREIPEAEIERLLVSLLASPVRGDLAAFLRKRLGRPLESFDVYLDEFVPPKPADEMNRLVRERFPDEVAFEKGLAPLLRSLGFAAADADFLSANIAVEIARGSGHAVRPGLPQYRAWLRTHRLPGELGWDGFDTGMHELGHVIEQVVSTHRVPRPALRGVPNTACTEAFAFLYQSLGRRVLGLDAIDEATAHDLDAVQTYAMACQIAGPALLELRVWNWIYANPKSTAAELRDRVLLEAERLWAEHYAEHFGPDPYRILAAYQHMINHPLYLADYPLGQIISHQIRSHLRGKDLAAETIRICSTGSVTPDLWMRTAVGAGISAEPLVRDAGAALGRMAAQSAS
jgi:hypothetical protein